MRRTCPRPRSIALSPPPPSRLCPEAKGMRKESEPIAEGTGKSQGSFLVTGQSLVQRGLGGPGRTRASGVRWLPQLLSPHRVLASGHQPASSVLRSPAMGALGGEFLSSLPLHEYPPAFPLGADIQGRTRHQVGPLTVPSSPDPVRTRSLSELSGSAKGHNSGNSFFFFFCSKGVRQEVDFNFFLPRFRFIFFPSD